ncbi:MAG: hypothetical protein QOJ56_6538 [Mycobacterium sp.]|jgi:hypothetical protein|nr:hypothetical protein [Mycobacterium sp.]
MILCCNIIGNIEHSTPHNAGFRLWDSMMVIRQTPRGRRHSDESIAKNRDALPETASIRESLQGWARKSGHERETNRCGHEVRQTVSAQLRASRLDMLFENLQ